MLLVSISTSDLFVYLCTLLSENDQSTSLSIFICSPPFPFVMQIPTHFQQFQQEWCQKRELWCTQQYSKHKISQYDVILLQRICLQKYKNICDSTFHSDVTCCFRDCYCSSGQNSRRN